jgi:hypothetical protein
MEVKYCKEKNRDRRKERNKGRTKERKGYM